MATPMSTTITPRSRTIDGLSIREPLPESLYRFRNATSSNSEGVPSP